MFKETNFERDIIVFKATFYTLFVGAKCSSTYFREGSRKNNSSASVVTNVTFFINTTTFKYDGQ
jgi:hypothetical protein